MNAGKGHWSRNLHGSASAAALRICLAAAAFGPVLLGAAEASAAEADPKAVELEEVVVTARQRSESLQDTPFSIAAVSGEQLQAQNIVSTMDLDNRIPSLQLRPDNTRLTPFVGLRGVGDIARNPGIDARVGIYLDGAPLGRSAVTNYPIFDIESVEVLRGPQGTLFGNNSMTGVISMTSQKPTFDESSRMTFGAGSRNLFYGNGYINSALSDELAVRLTLAGRSQEGYYKNVYDGGTLGGGISYAGRVQLRYTPTDKTTVDVSLDGVSARDDVLLVVGRQVAGPGVALNLPDYTVSLNVPPIRNRELYGANIVVNHELPGEYELTTITSYRTSEDALHYDTDGLPIDSAAINLRNRDWSFSQEARIASPKNDLYDYVLGAFYYYQRPSNSYTYRIGPQNPSVAARGTVLTSNGEVESSQFALFAHGSWRPVSWLTFDAGLRWQTTEKKFEKLQVNGVAAGFPNIDVSGSLKDESVNPMFSVTLKPVDDVSLYALYSTGDRVGGVNIDLLRTVTGMQFGSESVENYEVGLKSQLFNNRLRLNIAAYREVFTDFQVQQTIVDTAFTPPRTAVVITNAAQAKSEGVEVDFDFAATDALRLSGGMGFNRAWFVSFPNGGGIGVDYTGNRLPEAPRFQASLATTYEFDLSQDWGGTASLNYAYRSYVYSSPANNRSGDNRFLEGGFGSVGGRVSLVNVERNLELALYVRNLTDEQHVEGAAVSSGGAMFQTFNEPRTFGVELTLRH